MIKINLASRKQSSIIVETRNGRGGGVGSLQGLQLSDLKELPLRKVAVPILVGIMASYSLDSYKEDILDKVDKAVAKQKSEETRLKKELDKIKEYEALKLSLESDEITIKTKLDTISKLMVDRGYMTKMLLSVASGIPKDVWLTEVKADRTLLTFIGSSLGFNQISDFIKNLNDSQFFTSVELVNSQQAKAFSDIASFEVKAKRK